MGVDVNLYVEADPSDDEVAAAEAFFIARSNLGDPWDKSPEILRRENNEWLATPRVLVQTLSRYYGPGYERGDWPTIFGGIATLAAAFPGCAVFYGGDTHDQGVECTSEYLAQIWAHFLGPNGDDYRESWRAWSARNASTPPPPGVAAGARGGESCPVCAGSGVQPDYGPTPEFRPCERCGGGES